VVAAGVSVLLRRNNDGLLCWRGRGRDPAYRGVPDLSHALGFGPRVGA
jgi:hypothetical protein